MAEYGDGGGEAGGDGGGKSGADSHSVGEIVNAVAHDDHPSHGADVGRHVVGVTVMSVAMTVTMAVSVSMGVMVMRMSAHGPFRQLRSPITSL